MSIVQDVPLKNQRKKKKFLKATISVAVVASAILPVIPIGDVSVEASSLRSLQNLGKGAIVKFGNKEWYLVDPATGYLMLKEPTLETFQFSSVATDTLNSQDSRNIGHWLNNSFYNTLPNEDKNLIRSHTWSVGPHMAQSSNEITKVSLPLAVELQNFYNQTLGGLIPRSTWSRSGIMTGKPDSGKQVYVVYAHNGIMTNMNPKPSTESHSVQPVLYLDMSKNPKVLNDGTIVVNSNPTIKNPIGNKTIVNKGASFSLSLAEHFGDSSWDTLNYTVTSSNEGVATGSVNNGNLTVYGAGKGGANITVVATDTSGAQIQQTFYVEVGNTSPIVTNGIPNQSIAGKGRSVTLDLNHYFGDADNDALSYTVSDANSNVSVSVSNNILTITGTGVGNSPITIAARDTSGATISQTFTTFIYNTAPNISGVSFPTIVLMDNNSNFKVTGHGSDTDNDLLTASATIGSQQKTAPLSNGTFEMTFYGNAFQKGVESHATTVYLTDGVENSQNTTGTITTIKVDNLAHYNNALSAHDGNTSNWLVDKHTAFYNAYHEVIAFENGTTQYSNAKNAIDQLKNVTGITDSATILDWEARINALNLGTLISTAENSLNYADYDAAKQTFDVVSNSIQNQYKARMTHLQNYHNADSKLVIMESEVAQPTGANGKLNKDIVNWDKIKEVQDVIVDIPNNTKMKTKANTRLSQIIIAMLGQQEEIKPEDLDELEGENVDVTLSGWYNEFIPFFGGASAIVSNDNLLNATGQNLIDFVNTVKYELTNLSSDSSNNILAKPVPTSAVNVRSEIADYVSALYNYYAGLGVGTPPAFNVDFNNTKTPLTAEYSDKAFVAVKDVFVYNTDQTTANKDTAATSVSELFEGVLKTNLNSYLDNGLPSVILTTGNFVQSNGLTLTGSATDENDTEVTISLKVGNEAAHVFKVTKTEDTKQFSETLPLAKGVYENIEITVKDKLTETSQVVTQKIVITANDVRMNEMLDAYLKDVSQATINDLTVAELTGLNDLLDTIESSNSSNVQTVLNDFKADYAGKENLIELVTGYLSEHRLQALYENISTAPLEDFEALSIASVTTDNLEDMRDVVNDYKVHDPNKKFATSQDYTDWAAIVEDLVEVRQIVKGLESLTESSAIKDAVTLGKQILDAVPNWISEKAGLLEMLNEADANSIVIAAVEKAETNLTQKDHDEAKLLVDALDDGQLKVDLTARLDEVQSKINDAYKQLQGLAEKAVEKAEKSWEVTDFADAKTLVDSLHSTDALQGELNQRLDDLQALLDELDLVEKNVVKAESSRSEKDIETAQSSLDTLVAKITDGHNSKTQALQDRLDILSGEWGEKYKEVIDAIEKAEKEKTDDSISDAQSKLDQLIEDIGNGGNSKTDDLQQRIDDLIALLDLYEKAENAVEKAEASRTDEDVVAAQDAIDDVVDALDGIENDFTNGLQERLDELNRIKEAEKAVERAEKLKTQGSKDAAQKLVTALKDGDDKTALQERLDKLQLELEGKVTDLLDKLIDDPYNVTEQELADYVKPEPVYEEIFDEYIEGIVKEGDSLTKDKVIQIVRLVNALEISKRSMQQQDISVYESELQLAQALLAGDLSTFPTPTFLFTIERYMTDDTALADLISIVATEMNVSVAEVQSELDKIRSLQNDEGVQKGVYTIRYLDESGPLIHEKLFENVPFGKVAFEHVPIKGYKLIEGAELPAEFELTEETNGMVFDIIMQTAEVTETEKPGETLTAGTVTVVYIDAVTKETLHTEIISDVPLNEELFITGQLEGYAISGEKTLDLTLSEDNNAATVTFYATKAESETENSNGVYSVRYIDSNQNVVFEKTFNNVPLGTVTFDHSVLNGYKIASDNVLESFELTEHSQGQTFEFIVEPTGEANEGSNTGETPSVNEVKSAEVKAVYKALDTGDLLGELAAKTVDLSTKVNVTTQDTATVTPETELASFTYKFVDIANNDVLFEEVVTSVPYGEVTLTASLQGYNVILDDSIISSTFEKSFVLDEVNKNTVIEIKVAATNGTSNMLAPVAALEVSPIADFFSFLNTDDETTNVQESEENSVVEMSEQLQNTVKYHNATPQKTAIMKLAQNEDVASASFSIQSNDDVVLITSTSNANVTVATENDSHAAYLAKAFYALEGVKTAVATNDADHANEVKLYVVNNLLDGHYKKTLLSLLGVNITDLNNGNDGEPDLTQINPTPSPSAPEENNEEKVPPLLVDPPPTVTPTPPPVVAPPTVVVPPPVVAPPTVVAPPPVVAPPTVVAPPPTIVVPSTPTTDNKVVDKENTIVVAEVNPPSEGEQQNQITVSETNDSTVWTIKNPSNLNSEFVFEGKGIKITLPLDEFAKDSIKTIEFTWKHLGKNHYQALLKLNGIPVQTLSKAMKVEKTDSAAYLVKGQFGSYEALPYKKKASVFEFSTKDLTKAFYFSNVKRTFNDVKGLYSQDAIEKLASRYILLGTTPTTYSPYTNVTRAQLSAMIARALGLETTKEITLNDVVGHWAEKEIRALSERGIVVGTSSTHFQPNAELTRQEAALMIYRLLKAEGVKLPNTKPSFKDNHLFSNEVSEAVGALQNLDIFEGYKGNFMPTDKLTRVQMAKVLDRALELTGKY